MKLKDYREKRMRDPEVQAAYLKLRPKLELGRQILDARLERGWTQKELAEKAGTKQANISRLENALLNPSVEMLQKLANALGARLEIQLVPEGRYALADQATVEQEVPSSAAVVQYIADATAQEPWIRTSGTDPWMAATIRFFYHEAWVKCVDATDESAGSHEEEPIPVYNWPGVEKRSRVGHVLGGNAAERPNL